MHRDTLLELAPHAVQVCAPLLGAAADHHYTKKEMEMRKDFEMEKAERMSQGLQQMAGGQPQPAQGQPPQAHHDQPTQPQQPTQPSSGDVYERLRELRSETQCSFCQSAASELLDKPRDVAEQGERELRQYLERASSLRAANASRDKVEAEMGQLTDDWEVVPDIMAGVV